MGKAKSGHRLPGLGGTRKSTLCNVEAKGSLVAKREKSGVGRPNMVILYVCNFIINSRVNV